MTMEAGVGVVQPQAKDCRCREKLEEAGNGVSPEASRRNWRWILAPTLILDF